MKFKWTVCLLSMLLATAACRKDEDSGPGAGEDLQHGQPETLTTLKGFLLLNEGNMNMNKASLDYYDYTTGVYRSNVFEKANAGGSGLGDVGNDLAVYGSKVYIVVNGSNKIEVLDARTWKKIRQINLDNCRYITFSGGKAYVSAYLGVVGDPAAPQGSVSEIDTASLTIMRRATVGRQPEELAVVGNRLYVAHSGGYSPSNYERTVAVIDLTSFREIKRIDVAVNLHRLRVDAYGDLYVSSRGDYYDIPPRLYVIDTGTDAVKKSFNLAVSDMDISSDTAYICGTAFSYQTGRNEISYSMLDVRTETQLQRSFLSDGMDRNGKITLPYGLAINPENKDILITDAKDYVSPGKLHCFSKSGKLKWSVATGDIPAKIEFLKKTP
ncbi:hypothetical protein C7T94_10195 [Pedobacter yulinensis]|uniref:YncE family protein n=1 Tax=Pedobacter yulinensis TaxID=2126353 RepID=A0A2T3HKP4_9SPHI|nr:DUF5074 domain-containing protein [Pedobacter yulinensis]PST82989.1 hypothetical protein C7T94_10195 [Pedobacter yulinensis]